MAYHWGRFSNQPSLLWIQELLKNTRLAITIKLKHIKIMDGEITIM